MKSRVLKWFAAGLIAVVLVAGTGLFLFRGALLRCVADEKLAALEQRITCVLPIVNWECLLCLSSAWKD